jgi:transposase
MAGYSMDLRERVVAAVDRGVAKRDVAEMFGVSVRTINRYLRLRRETESLAPRPIPGRPSVKGAALRAGLVPQLKANADATLSEHCALWEGAGGMPVSEATMSRAISKSKLGWPLKKSAEGSGAG